MGVAPQAYRQERQDIREVRVEDGQTVTLDFKIPRRGGAAVTGMVIGLDGKPAGGIAVRAQTSEIEEFAYTRTDAQGRFHFDALAPGTPVSVQDGALGTAEPTSVQEGQGEIRLQLVRRVKLTLKGIVTDEQGKPIPHARIKLTESVGRYGHGDSQPRLSGADGTYEIGDLYTDNRYSIAAEADGFGEAQARLHLDANTRQLPTLKLPRADAVTGGIVVDPEGKPVAGIPVHLNNGNFPKTVPTDAQGRFSFPVVPGKNHLIWIAVKGQAKVGPNANGRAGRNDIKLVLPKEEQ
jgi:protocatechuate 3,4-dioxygenase beta subunit